MEFKGLPGIDDYFASKDYNLPIEVSELDQIIEAIIAYTGVTKEQSIRILSLFFNELRTNMLNGNLINIRHLGSFVIQSPSTTKTKNIFVQFKPKKSLIKRMNNV